MREPTRQEWSLLLGPSPSLACPLLLHGVCTIKDGRAERVCLCTLVLWPVRRALDVTEKDKESHITASGPQSCYYLFDFEFAIPLPLPLE